MKLSGYRPWLIFMLAVVHVPEVATFGDDESDRHEEALRTLRSSGSADVLTNRHADRITLTLRNPTKQDAQAVGDLIKVDGLSVILSRRGDEWIQCLENARLVRNVKFGGAIGFELLDEDVRGFPRLNRVQTMYLFRINANPAGWKQVSDGIRAEKLTISSSNLSPESIRHLATIPDLRELFISNSSMTGEGLAALAAAKSLEALSLSDTKLTDKGLLEVATILSLKSIHLNRGDITNEGIRQLLRLEHLESLSLSRIDITDETVASFAGFPKLKSLSVTDTKTFTGDSLVVLQNVSLESVAFGRTKLGDQGFAALAVIPTLKTIWIPGTRVTPESLAAFEGLDRPLKIGADTTRIRSGAAREFSVRNPKAWIEVGTGQTLTAYQNGIALSGGPDKPVAGGGRSGK